jgi:hypothetical protein
MWCSRAIDAGVVRPAADGPHRGPDMNTVIVACWTAGEAPQETLVGARSPVSRVLPSSLDGWRELARANDLRTDHLRIDRQPVRLGRHSQQNGR